jgi:hypothetical protein
LAAEQGVLKQFFPEAALREQRLYKDTISNDLAFIQVRDLADGITENSLPHSDQLAGAYP